MVEADTVGSGHSGAAAIGEVQAVRIIPNIIHIIHQEVVDTVVQIAVRIDSMDERVDIQAAYQTEVGIAEAVIVDDVRFVGDKVSEQRAGEPPLPYSRAIGFNVAKRNLHQTQLAFITVKRSSVHSEIHCQTFLVVDDFRFGSLQKDILGRSCASVMDNNA